jgi:plasmid stability protein
MIASSAFTAYIACMQYTLRNIPSVLDRLLRQRARRDGKSLNDVAIEALSRGAGLTGERVKHRDLGDLAGLWQDDPTFDQAIREQDVVDDHLWK